MVKQAVWAMAVTLCLSGAAFAGSTGSSGSGSSDASGSQSPSMSGSGSSSGGTDATGTDGSSGTTDTTGTAQGTDHALPRTWEGEIGNAFFADPQGRTLRSQSEVQRNWSSLTAEQQAQVRMDCQNMAGNSSTGTTTGSTGSTTTDSGSTVGSEVAPPRESAASVDQVCSWVDGM